LPTPSSTTSSQTPVSTVSTGGALQLKRQFNGYGNSYLPPVNVILIAGIDPTANNWTWPSVYVPQGWYQLYANVQNTVQSTSSSFFVQNGTNTNCVVQYAPAPSTPAHSSSTTAVPAATNSSTSAAASSGHHSNAGAIAGGVIGGIAFLAAAFVAFLYWYLRRRSSRSQFHDEDNGSRRWSELAFVRKSRPGNSTRSSTQKAPPAVEGDQTIIGSEEEISTVGHEKAIAAAPPTFQPSPNQPTRTQSLRASTQTNGSYRTPESPGARASYGSRPGEAIPLERSNTAGGSVTVPRRKPAPRYEGAAGAEVRRDGRSSSQTTLDFTPHGNSANGSPDSVHVLQHKSSFGAVRPMHVMTTDPPTRAA
jgi:hypothetical protein